MTAELELYGARTGNCFRVSIALEESGLPFTTRHVNLREAAHQTPAFLALNPAGKVPVLVDRRVGGEFVLSQSNAILLHLAEVVPDKLMPFGSGAERARFYERLFYFVTDVIAPSHAGFLLRSAGETTGADTLSGRSISNLIAAERFLDDGPYMMGDRYSLVDITALTIAAANQNDLDWHAVPRLHAWFGRVMSRPGVIRGFQTFASS